MSLRPVRRRSTVRIPIEDKGAMNFVAQSKFGIPHATKIPNRLIPKYVDALVDLYGEKQARGMIQAQLNFRKRKKNTEAYRKFELMLKYWNLRYKDRR